MIRRTSVFIKEEPQATVGEFRSVTIYSLIYHGYVGRPWFVMSS